MSRIDQTSGIAVGVCVAVMPQTVKTPASTAYSRVTARTLIWYGFQREMGGLLCQGWGSGPRREVAAVEVDS